jgi:cyclopropane-fatty-acyl-phospholipid synthase
LTIEDGPRVFRLGPDADPLAVTLRAEQPTVWGQVLRRGVLGAGEAYADGAWTADDLVGAVRLFLRNRPVMERLDRGWARFSRPLLARLHARRANTRDGSRRNIAAHYDLGEDFFALMLDETMTYSGAVFERDDMTLAAASAAKYERLCRKLALDAHHHVLEIGCGWGGFAVHAARQHGCRVTAVTISRAQARYTRERVRREGLDDLVQVVERDYRDLDGAYDRVVSIEMIEAVGHEFLATFLKACADRLGPDGMLGLQAITMPHEHYDRSRRNVDFIKRWIFPGSFIPSREAIEAAAAGVTDLVALDEERFGLHYARTLRLWRERFLGNVDAVRALGFDERFVRMWTYYLAYCEGAFHEAALDSTQIVLGRPAALWAPRALVAPALVGV